MRRIALLAAILVGAVSFALLVQSRRRFEEQASGGRPVPVLVASTEIALGDLLGEDQVAVREIPESYVDTRHIRASDADKALGIRTTMALRPNESLLWTDLAVASEERRVLSGLVKSGMRALSVRIERGASLGGLLRPGDRIDLLLRAERAEGAVVLPLLQNILVLAVGGNFGDTSHLLDAVQGSSDLTLSVTIAQARALTLAQAEGSLSASLRNPDDIVVQRDSPITTSQDIHLDEKRSALQERRATGTSRNRERHTQEIEHVR